MRASPLEKRGLVGGKKTKGGKGIFTCNHEAFPFLKKRISGTHRGRRGLPETLGIIILSPRGKGDFQKALFLYRVLYIS